MSTLSFNRIDFGEHIFSLSNLLEKHQECTDFLSRNILRWGAGVLKGSMDHQYDSNEDQVEFAKAKIDVLARQILVDPITNHLFREPIIERGWTWETSVHSLYQNIYPCSPMDGEEWMEKPPTHKFAEELLNWMYSLPFSETINIMQQLEEERSLVVYDPKVHPSRSVLCSRLARVALVQQESQQLCEKMDFIQNTINETMVTYNDSRELIMQTERSLAQSELEIQTRIENVKKSNKEKQDSLEKEWLFLNKSQGEEITKLDDQIAHEKANTETLKVLNEQLAQRKEEHKRERLSLTNLIASQKKHFDEELKKLEAQKKSIAKTHKEKEHSLRSEISSKARSNDEKINALRSQINSILTSNDQTLQSLKSDIISKNTSYKSQDASQVENNNRTISDLEGQYNQKMTELNAFIDKNKNSLNKFSAILKETQTKNEQGKAEIRRLQNAYKNAHQEFVKKREEEQDSRGFCILM